MRGSLVGANLIEEKTNEEAYEVAREERVRRRIVTLIFVIYWLLIFEGALRKWVFPQFYQALFYVRDPFVLWVYWLALKNRRWPRWSLLLTGGVVLSLLALLPVIVQLFDNLNGLLVAGYGWRNYFYYIPLAFIIGEQFRLEDLHRLIKHSLLIAPPVAVLVFFQFFSPAEAPINSGLIEGGLLQAGVIEGVIRTYGTFTSSSGQTPFVVSIVAMVLICWILPANERPVKPLLLLAGTGAALTCLAVSGSRGAFLHSGFVLVLAIGAALVVSRDTMRARSLVLTLVVGLIAVLLIPVLFPTAFDAILQRSTEAYAVESELYAFGTAGRIFYDFIHFTFLLPDTPIFGYGLGLFGNANLVDASSLLNSTQYVEDDWSRNVVELGPLLGVLYIFFRVALVTWLAVGALRATHRSNNPLPLLLTGFIGVLLLYGQLTGQGSVNGYGWLFTGFVIAANRHFGEEDPYCDQPHF